MINKQLLWLGKLALAIVSVLSLVTASRAALPPNPRPGDFKVLEVLEKLSAKNIDQAMKQFPVPFAVLTRSTNPAAPGGFVETLDTFRSGSPKRIDVDNNLATGKGGKDVEVIVEQLLGPPFQLQLTINRLDPPSGQTATDLSIVIAFPTDAFNAEILAAPPLSVFRLQHTRESRRADNLHSAIGTDYFYT